MDSKATFLTVSIVLLGGCLHGTPPPDAGGMNRSKGKGMYATFVNIDTPDVSVFQPYVSGGLKRLSVFVFEPSATSLPTTVDWFTTKAGHQPQGLDTNGGSTVGDWQGLFQSLDEQGVAIGFVFGGEGGTGDLGPMMQALNGSSTSFADFVKSLQAYHVSYIEFDIEGTWDTPPGFADHFESFASNLRTHSAGSISILVGASAPVGTVDGAGSNMPSYVTNDFVTANNVFFNVYTYYLLEVANVLDDPTPWIPTTEIDPSRIAFSVTCNARQPAPSGQITFSAFMDGFPDSYFLKKVKADYLGMFVWVWWQKESDYPEENLKALFELIP